MTHKFRDKQTNKQANIETHTLLHLIIGGNLRLYGPEIKKPSIRIIKIPKTATISRTVTIPMLVTILRQKVK